MFCFGGGGGGGGFSTASRIFRNSANISSSFDNYATSKSFAYIGLIRLSINCSTAYGASIHFLRQGKDYRQKVS
jgi:hypothetical protein